MTEGDQARVEREAAEWAARLNQRQVDSQSIEDFYAWRREGANASAFEKVTHIWERSGQLAADSEIARALAGALDRPTVGERLTRWLSRPGTRPALAAALAIALAGVAALFLLAMPTAYETAVGEQRLVVLDDGSRIRINTDSRLEQRFTRHERRIAIDRGEAFFEVAHDAGRPFVVDAGESRVTALGTRFDVRRDAKSVQVLLAEGAVEVRDGLNLGSLPIRLVPGDGLTLRAGRKAEAVRVDTAALTSWTSGKIVLTDTPLAAAVAEVNRYAKARIELAAPGLADARVNGSFDIGDTDAFILAVTELMPLRAEPLPGGGKRLVPAV
ncbi:transcriptional regulator [Sphingomonas sp. DBB INV C78]|uniref:FecR family protein n=1 Tax=Sphingomonas sp. DBB INV C78 TaxID=3349434 RepID=UPI0036D3067D